MLWQNVKVYMKHFLLNNNIKKGKNEEEALGKNNTVAYPLLLGRMYNMPCRQQQKQFVFDNYSHIFLRGILFKVTSWMAWRTGNGSQHHTHTLLLPFIIYHHQHLYKKLSHNQHRSLFFILTNCICKALQSSKVKTQVVDFSKEDKSFISASTPLFALITRISSFCVPYKLHKRSSD